MKAHYPFINTKTERTPGRKQINKQAKHESPGPNWKQTKIHHDFCKWYSIRKVNPFTLDA